METGQTMTLRGDVILRAVGKVGMRVTAGVVSIDLFSILLLREAFRTEREGYWLKARGAKERLFFTLHAKLHHVDAFLPYNFPLKNNCTQLIPF